MIHSNTYMVAEEHLKPPEHMTEITVPIKRAHPMRTFSFQTILNHNGVAFVFFDTNQPLLHYEVGKNLSKRTD